VTFKPEKWYPAAIALSVLNVIAVPFASGSLHATAHIAAAVAFGIWARHLGRQRPQEANRSLAAADAIAALEDEMSTLRRELVETQERLDFAERMLARRPDPPR
jgi:hypothetical protein